MALWTTALATILIFTCIAFVNFWVAKYYDGFSDRSTNYPFYYHPVMMSWAYVFFVGQALIAWREKGWGIKTPPRPFRKALHAIFNLLALGCTIVGLYVVFLSHNRGGTPNLYSVHSWVGFGTVISTFLLWVVSFFVFVWPTANDQIRKIFVIYHRFFGAIIFGLGIISCYSGTVEKQLLLQSTGVSKYSEIYIVGNVQGLLFVATGIAVFFQIFTKHLENDVPDSQLLIQHSTTEKVWG